MVLKHLRYLLFPSPEERDKRKEERAKESKLEADLKFLARLSKAAKSRPGYGYFTGPYKEKSEEHLEYY